MSGRMRRSSARWRLAAGLVLLAAPARAAEQAVAADPKAAFAQSDSNADGGVDLEEFHQHIVDVFYVSDEDKDGSLSTAELAQLPHPEKLADLDRNGDGKVSLQEFVRVRYLQFKEADTNQDAELSLEEVLVVYRVGWK
jgi:Ca2+-binding EF-hand superfamily protein